MELEVESEAGRVPGREEKGFPNPGPSHGQPGPPPRHSPAQGQTRLACLVFELALLLSLHCTRQPRGNLVKMQVKIQWGWEFIFHTSSQVMQCPQNTGCAAQV